MAAQPSLKVGDLVHVMHRNCAKHEPLWNPGFCITRKISDTCFKVFHSGTRTRLVRNVRSFVLESNSSWLLPPKKTKEISEVASLGKRDDQEVTCCASHR